MTIQPQGSAPPAEAASIEHAALWRALRLEGSQAAREQLFTVHAQFARGVAGRHFRRGRAPDIELQDLRQLAYAGLLEAIDRFDPQQGAPFRGFAARRITGSILNGIAKLSEMREQISHRNRVKAERLRSLSTDGLRSAEAVEALAALTDLAVGLAMGFMLDEAGVLVGQGEADPAPSAYESLAWRDMLRRLSAEIQRLPDRERLILRGHYLDGVDFVQLAAVLRLSKGRVSQLHKNAIGRLRERLAQDDPFHLTR